MGTRARGMTSASHARCALSAQLTARRHARVSTTQTVAMPRMGTKTRSITAPGVIELGDENNDAVVWKRLGQEGVDKAVELWSSVNSEAAAAAKGAWAGVKPAHKVFLSDILASPKRNAFLRKWIPTDITYVSFIGVMHLGCLLAPFTFTWGAFKCFLAMYYHWLPRYHAELSQADCAQVAPHAQVARVRARVLRC